jgi:hypothetical protein
LRLQTETLPAVGFAGAFLTGRRIWATLAPALRLGLGICRCGALGGLELGGQKVDDLPLKHALPKAWPPAARPRNDPPQHLDEADQPGRDRDELIIGGHGISARRFHQPAR